MNERTDTDRRTDYGSIDTVTVIGAGSVGHGIPEVSAIAGQAVTLRDVEPDLVGDCLIGDGLIGDGLVGDGLDEREWNLGKLDEKGRGFGLLTTTDDVIEGVEAFRRDRDPDVGGG